MNVQYDDICKLFGIQERTAQRVIRMNGIQPASGTFYQSFPEAAVQALVPVEVLAKGYQLTTAMKACRAAGINSNTLQAWVVEDVVRAVVIKGLGRPRYVDQEVQRAASCVPVLWGQLHTVEQVELMLLRRDWYKEGTLVTWIGDKELPIHAMDGDKPLLRLMDVRRRCVQALY